MGVEPTTSRLQGERNNHYANEAGHLRESNPGPLAPKARIIPLDQGAKQKNAVSGT